MARGAASHAAAAAHGGMRRDSARFLSRDAGKELLNPLDHFLDQLAVVHLPLLCRNLALPGAVGSIGRALLFSSRERLLFHQDALPLITFARTGVAHHNGLASSVLRRPP